MRFYSLVDLRCVSRQRFVALGQPLKIFSVIRVGEVKGDKGIVREALDALGGAKHAVRKKLIHCYSSADAV